MIPRLSRPIFKSWSEIPLCIGMIGFLIYLAFYSHNCWVLIQHCGGLLEAIHDFYSVD